MHRSEIASAVGNRVHRSEAAPEAEKEALEKGLERKQVPAGKRGGSLCSGNMKVGQPEKNLYGGASRKILHFEIFPDALLFSKARVWKAKV